MSFLPPNSLLPDFSGPPPSGPVVIMDPAGSPVPLATGPNAYLISVLSSIAIALNYVPFVLLYRAKNIPACTTIVVIVVMNLFVFINAIIWPNNDTTAWWDGAGLCDIEVYVRTMCATLIATATAGLTRNLAQAVDTDKPRLYESAAQRRRRYITEILFCFAIPASQLINYYFIQAGRYAVLTVFGCVPIVDNSWPTLVLFLIWPPIFALLNCYYAILVMIRLRRHRGTLSSTLSSNGSSFNARKFIKLFLLSMCFLVIYLPVTLIFFYLNVPSQLHDYSWSYIHNPEQWGTILFLTDNIYPKNQYYAWPVIAMGFASFNFFGLNNEAIELYRKCITNIGFGRIWPSLREPRVIRRRGSNQPSSWSSHLDIVGKALHYLDGSRKQSTGGPDSECVGSRKGSAATFDHITLTNVTTTSNSPILAKGTSTSKTASRSDYQDAGIISTPIQSHSGSKSKRASPTHQPQPLFSAFRTHMNLPFPLFNHKKAGPAEDLEAQSRRFSGNQTVETNIWSGPSAHEALEDEERVDPTEPKIGTRAYRERERRERNSEKDAEEARGTAVKLGPEDSVQVSKTLDQTSAVSSHP